MLRVSVDKIRPGMILARPVPLPHDPFRYLLQRNREIPMTLVPRLQQLGVNEVWVRQRSLEFLEEVIDPELVDRQRDVYWSVRRNFEAIMQDATVELDMVRFQSSIADLFQFLKQSRCGNVLLQKLDAFDNYLMSHSTNVCYLSLLLGMKLERYLIDQRSCKSAREAKDLRELGLGCLLHDVGKMRIPLEILNKPGKLTAEEMETMKLHPVYGFEMVKGRVPPAAAQVVLNHHQRYEGGGYPQRIDPQTGEPLPSMQGTRIPVLCRISSICDVYDAATANRVYSGAKPSVQALHEMRTYCRGFFDPAVERAFYEIIPPFPIGQVVTLSDGMEAAVIDFNPRWPLQPKVQGIRYPNGESVADPSLEEIDLALYPDLQITEVDGKDVRGFMDLPESVDDPATALA